MPSFSFSYEYDGAGNRTKKINNLTSEVTTYTYDSANQLISMEEPGGNELDRHNYFYPQHLGGLFFR